MIYFYECSDCHFYFPAGDNKLELCPSCGKKAISWKRCKTGKFDERDFLADQEPSEFSGVYIATKKRTRANGFYDVGNRGFHPDVGKTISPDAYEKAHEADWENSRKRSLEVKNARSMSKKSDDMHVTHKGSIPLAQFLARQAEVKHDTDQLFDTDYWKHQGRIFDHAKDA